MSVKPKRILFVTHVLDSRYGAATSLRTLLESYRGVEADIVTARSLRRARDYSSIAAKMSSVRKVHEFFLPLDFDVLGIRLRGADALRLALQRAMWARER